MATLLKLHYYIENLTNYISRLTHTVAFLSHLGIISQNLFLLVLVSWCCTKSLLLLNLPKTAQLDKSKLKNHNFHKKKVLVWRTRFYKTLLNFKRPYITVVLRRCAVKTFRCCQIFLTNHEFSRIFVNIYPTVFQVILFVIGSKMSEKFKEKN